MTSPVNVDVKLGVNKFNVDEEHPHIVVKADADKQALELLVKACPAGLYKKQDDGSVRFDYAGCLECGTCRILGLGSALEQWEYPRGTFVWSSVTADVGLIRNAALTLIAKNRNNHATVQKL
ncbi:ferredoxin-like protein [Escherichia coli]|uniref:Ferredoxin-like protein n=1 Tax=Escherichia coli TaxID=562 RepID=A0A377CGM3_ECOLX|nr:ferredoxin-like protein [Escherichia coli]